uniref:Reverse transcriptase/retrotransposon-derived protein RNase H-like domain-containing protein n=1 Tax=Esox lucius TaxID=8010 RepID=A0A6Q2X4G6_ESOLU
MRSFIGRAGYCRPWIPDFDIMARLLIDSYTQDAPNNTVWTEEKIDCFNGLKAALMSAPALGLPDYNLPFMLAVAEKGGFAQGVLLQDHGGQRRPVAYYTAVGFCLIVPTFVSLLSSPSTKPVSW